MESKIWLVSNEENAHIVHVGLARVAHDGSTYYVTQCSKKTLGGSWGYTKFSKKPSSVEWRDCKKCDTRSVCGETLCGLEHDPCSGDHTEAREMNRTLRMQTQEAS
jgi:hypothetical protein